MLKKYNKFIFADKQVLLLQKVIEKIKIIFLWPFMYMHKNCQIIRMFL